MKRVVFVGQAMPRVKRHPHDWPALNAWLYTIGLNDEHIKSNFIYTALVDYFPGSKNGSHIVPSEAEIKKERKRLQNTLKNFNPDLVVTIGKLSLSHCLRCKVNLLKEYIGQHYEVDPYGLIGKKLVVIPMPHPSGASTWKHKPENKKLLLKSLSLLRSYLY